MTAAHSETDHFRGRVRRVGDGSWRPYGQQARVVSKAADRSHLDLPMRGFRSEQSPVPAHIISRSLDILGDVGKGSNVARSLQRIALTRMRHALRRADLFLRALNRRWAWRSLSTAAQSHKCPPSLITLPLLCDHNFACRCLLGPSSSTNCLAVGRIHPSWPLRGDHAR